MRIMLYVGVFFLVLAGVFALSARTDFLAAQHRWMPAARTHGRVAIIFAIVGAGLVLTQLIFR